MSKPFFVAFFIIIILGESALASIQLGAGQSGTNVTGIITTNTTWTKANSPYNVVGNVLVASGVTLTIEAGTSVDFGAQYIMVNGTLKAQGTISEPITIITGDIRFTEFSSNWNEQTSTGSIIENAQVSQNSKITVEGASPKIADSSILGKIEVSGGSPIFSNNLISNAVSLTINGGTPLIVNNRIRCQVIVQDGSPTIFSNSIKPNSFTGVEVNGGNPYVTNNNITDCNIGISATSGVIERNYVSTSTVGIEIGNGVVRNNTVESVKVILVLASSKPTIIYNNFPFATVGGINGVVLAEGANYDVDVANNWWGTTDSQAINQSIYDFKRDFTLGKVSFVPFLTEPNSQAMPDPNAPIPTPFPTPTQTPAPSPSPSPTIPEFPSWIVLLVAAIATLFVVMTFRAKKKIGL